jgi:hypothetical protein
MVPRLMACARHNAPKGLLENSNWACAIGDPLSGEANV